MQAVVLVPRRRDGGRRDELWAHVRARWEAAGWPVYEGHHDDGPFNRSAAINQAADLADLAGRWDVAVIADSDTIVPAHQVTQAVHLAASSGEMTFAFERYLALDQGMSDRILAGYDGDWMPGVADSIIGSCSSCVVVSRTLWDEVGGFPEEFVSWGFEDTAFSLACQAIRGGYGHFGRIAGPVFHLWHESVPAAGNDQHPEWQANYNRFQPFVVAIESPDPVAAMRALLSKDRT